MESVEDGSGDNVGRITLKKNYCEYNIEVIHQITIFCHSI